MGPSAPKAIRLSNGHCCVCVTEAGSFCGHIGGPYLCGRHANPPAVIVLDRDLMPDAVLRPCPSKQWGVLGFERPTIIPCGQLEGHDGPHLYKLEWTD